MTHAETPAGVPAGMPARTVRIGITGPIGCGKSTVAAWLGELGAVVIDADQAARAVTQPGSDALAAIAATFGSDVLRDDGSLDRGSLGQIVFSDPEALARLEAIVHPAVRPVILREMAVAARSGAAAVVVEAIKLVEGGLAELCDEVWLIACDADQQLARLASRIADSGGDANDGADAEARIAAQAGLVERLAAHATRILDTSGDPVTTRMLVEAAYVAAVAPDLGGAREG